MEFEHIPVMLYECIDGLNIKKDGIYVDGTAGGAGHSKEIVKRLSSNGRLIAIDRDPDAIITAKDRLSNYKNAQVVHSNFCDIDLVLNDLSIQGVDGVLLDLGVSSHQLDVLERGFSYKGTAPLDMRMSQEGISAKDIVNGYEERELAKIIRLYGEEPFAAKIAKNIVSARNEKEIETTSELADIIKKSIPAAKKRDKNPCKRTFQAIRIAVNSELDSLEKGLDNAFSSLLPGGRLVVITFHSLEDRIVKHKFVEWCKGCTCPPDFPICVCGNKPKAKIINKKAIVASNEELANNKRSQSAKLRILEKL